MAEGHPQQQCAAPMMPQNDGTVKQGKNMMSKKEGKGKA